MKKNSLLNFLCIAALAFSAFFCIAAAPKDLTVTSSAETVDPYEGAIVRNNDTIYCGSGIYIVFSGTKACMKGNMRLELSEWSSSYWCTGWKLDGAWCLLPNTGDDRIPDGIQLTDGDGSSESPYNLDLYYAGKYNLDTGTEAHAEDTNGKRIFSANADDKITIIFDGNNFDEAIFDEWKCDDSSVAINDIYSPVSYFIMPDHNVSIRPEFHYDYYDESNNDYYDSEYEDTDDAYLFNLYFNTEEDYYYDSIGESEYTLVSLSNLGIAYPAGKEFKAWMCQNEGIASEHEDGLFYPGDKVWVDRDISFAAVWEDDTEPFYHIYTDKYCYSENSDGYKIDYAREGDKIYLYLDSTEWGSFSFERFECDSGDVQLEDADSPGASFTMPDHDVTITTITEAYSENAVTYFTNTADDETFTMSFEGTAILPTYEDCGFTKPANKHFGRWYNYDFDEYYDPGDTITISFDGSGFVTVWENDTDTDEQTMITLNKKEAELEKGETLELTYEITPESAKSLDVYWYSDDEETATVSDGKVQAVKPGTAVISVITEDGAFAECTVTVKEKNTENDKTELTLSMAEAELIVGKKLVLEPTIMPESAKDMKVTWHTDKSGIVDVFGGTVIALTPGVVTVTAMTEDGAYDGCVVTVLPKSTTDTDTSADTSTDTTTDTGTDTETDTYTDTDTSELVSNPLSGDVNEDGVVDSSDALAILRTSTGLNTFSDKQKLLGDVDGDGEITSSDALAVLRYSAGLSSNENIGKPISS